jgi:hypothetical protein
LERRRLRGDGVGGLVFADFAEHSEEVNGPLLLNIGANPKFVVGKNFTPFFARATTKLARNAGFDHSLAEAFHQIPIERRKQESHVFTWTGI